MAESTPAETVAAVESEDSSSVPARRAVDPENPRRKEPPTPAGK